MVLTAYLDESGTDEVSKEAALAGYVLDPVGFQVFEQDWQHILEIHELPYLHMKDFSPHGRFSHFTEAAKVALFRDLSEVIRQNALVGILTAVDTESYRRTISRDAVEQLFSPYAFLFRMSVELVASWAERYYQQEKIVYLLDFGNRYRAQIEDMYGVMKREQAAGQNYHLGPLSFDDDREYMALQAADMLAYETKKEFARKIGRSKRPRRGLFSELAKGIRYLEYAAVPTVSIGIFAQSADEWIAKLGGLPGPGARRR